MDDRTSKFAIEIAALRQRFIDGLPDRLTDIERAAAALRLRDDDTEVVKSAARALHVVSHKLAGAAGTFQVNELSVLASELEAMCMAMADRMPLPDEHRKIAKLISAMAACIDVAAAPNASPDNSPATHFPAVVQQGPLGLKRIALVTPASDEGAELAETIRLANYDVVPFSPDAKLWPALMEAAVDAVIIHGDIDLPLPPVVTKSSVSPPSRLPPLIMVGEELDFAIRLRAVRMGCEEFLPHTIDASPIIDAVERATVNDAGEPFRILVVDDDPEVATHMTLVLDEAGMIAESLVDPTRILELIETFAPELLLVNLHMPGCTGSELAARICGSQQFRLSFCQVKRTPTSKPPHWTAVVTGSCRSDNRRDSLHRSFAPEPHASGACGRS